MSAKLIVGDHLGSHTRMGEADWLHRWEKKPPCRPHQRRRQRGEPTARGRGEGHGAPGHAEPHVLRTRLGRPVRTQPRLPARLRIAAPHHRHRPPGSLVGGQARAGDTVHGQRPQPAQATHRTRPALLAGTAASGPGPGEHMTYGSRPGAPGGGQGGPVHVTLPGAIPNPPRTARSARGRGAAVRVPGADGPGTSRWPAQAAQASGRQGLRRRPRDRRPACRPSRTPRHGHRTGRAGRLTDRPCPAIRWG